MFANVDRPASSAFEGVKGLYIQTLALGADDEEAQVALRIARDNNSHAVAAKLAFFIGMQGQKISIDFGQVAVD